MSEIPGIIVMLNFDGTNCNTTQTVTVRAIDDVIDETSPEPTTVTNVAASGDSNYNGLSENVTVNVMDNEAADVTITQSGGSTDVSETGPTTDTYTVVLNTQPTADVTISFNTGTQIQPISSITFTPGNWNTAQTATWKWRLPSGQVIMGSLSVTVNGPVISFQGQAPDGSRVQGGISMTRTSATPGCSRQQAWC